MSSRLDEEQQAGICVLDLDVVPGPAVDQIMLGLGIPELWRCRRVNRGTKRRVEQELLSLPKAVLRVGGWVDESSGTVRASKGVRVFSFATMFWEARRELLVPVVHHTVCDTADGGVVVCGGEEGPMEVLHLPCGAPSWSYLPNLPEHVHGAASVELPDKRIMVVGGREGVNGPSQKAFILRADQSGWEQAVPMITERMTPAIAALPDGRVLVAGGRKKITAIIDDSSSSFDTAEIWDPATGCWTMVESMAFRRANPTACMLSDGRVMVMGGSQLTFDGSQISQLTYDCEIFDPAVNRWEMGAPLPMMSYGVDHSTFGNRKGLFKHTSIRAVAVRGGVLAADSSRDPFLYDEALGKWIRIPTSGGL